MTSYDQGTGKHPYSITIADFDNDHQMDIAIANSGTDNIDILAQYSDDVRKFQTTITHSTGQHSSPHGIAAADFDRNDQLDIAVANYANHSIMIILNPTNQILTQSYTYLCSGYDLHTTIWLSSRFCRYG
jgi:FG-GAP-like repeat